MGGKQVTFYPIGCAISAKNVTVCFSEKQCKWVWQGLGKMMFISTWRTNSPY